MVDELFPSSRPPGVFISVAPGDVTRVVKALDPIRRLLPKALACLGDTRQSRCW